MYIEKSIEHKVEQLLNGNTAHMGDALGIKFTSFAKNEVKAIMPVDVNTIQPFGILHGGASVALAETLASIGAWLNLNDDTKMAVGVEINANHLRSVPKGDTVKATAAPIKRGKKIHVWETKIYTETDKLVCVSRCTLAVVDNSSES